MFQWFRKKSFLTDAENKKIVEAIKSMEQLTSGEIRVYIESRNPLVNTIDRAKEIFFKLQMEKTKLRNAVLLYIAVNDREVAVYGDEGIHNIVGDEFWSHQVKQMIARFKDKLLAEGIEKCLAEVGNALIEKFPYDSSTDKNELPDEIVFGK